MLLNNLKDNNLRHMISKYSPINLKKIGKHF